MAKKSEIVKMDFMRKVKEFLENEDRRREMSEYSRKFVYDNFSLEKINKNLDNLYKEVLCV